MNALKHHVALLYIPNSPLNIVIDFKRIMKKDSLSLEELCEKLNIDLIYCKNMFQLIETYANEIRNFLGHVKLSSEEAANYLNISKEEVDKYLSILDS